MFLPLWFLLANSHRCVCSAEASQCPWMSRTRCGISLLPLRLLAGTCGHNFCISCSVLEGGRDSLFVAPLWVILSRLWPPVLYANSSIVKSPLPETAEWTGEMARLSRHLLPGLVTWVGSLGPMRRKERSTSMCALSLWVLCMQVCVHTGK